MRTKEDYYYFALVNILKANPSVDFTKDELNLTQALKAVIDKVANNYSKIFDQVIDDLKDMQLENLKNEQAEDDLRPGPD